MGLACLASRTGIWQLPNRGVPWSTRVATQRSYRSQLCATRRWRCSTSRQHMLKPFAASWKKSCRGLRPKTINPPILVDLTLQCCRLVEKGLTVVWNMSGFKINDIVANFGTSSFICFLSPPSTTLIPSAGWWAEGLCEALHLLPLLPSSYCGSHP